MSFNPVTDEISIINAPYAFQYRSRFMSRLGSWFYTKNPGSERYLSLEFYSNASTNPKLNLTGIGGGSIQLSYSDTALTLQSSWVSSPSEGTYDFPSRGI